MVNNFSKQTNKQTNQGIVFKNNTKLPQFLHVTSSVDIIWIHYTFLWLCQTLVYKKNILAAYENSKINFHTHKSRLKIQNCILTVLNL